MNQNDSQLLDILVLYFERDTMFSSRIESEHPYFKTIVGWGKQRPNEIIPWLLNHIIENWHWSAALWEIVGENNGPIIPDDKAGQGDFICNAWLDWGRDRGHIK